MKVNIETDYYPEETHWEILKYDTYEKVMFKDTIYGNCERLYSQSKCVDEGSYLFVVYDSSEDGMVSFIAKWTRSLCKFIILIQFYFIIVL